MENEKSIQKFKEQNEELRDEFMASIWEFKKMTKSGKIIIILDDFIQL